MSKKKKWIFLAVTFVILITSTVVYIVIKNNNEKPFDELVKTEDDLIAGFHEHKDAFVKVQEYCTANPDIAEEGITKENMSGLPIEKELNIIFNELKLRSIQALEDDRGRKYIRFDRPILPGSHIAFGIDYHKDPPEGEETQLAPDWYFFAIGLV